MRTVLCFVMTAYICFFCVFFCFKVDLKSGMNILYWRTTGILVEGKMVKPVLLKTIQIEGKAITKNTMKALTSFKCIFTLNKRKYLCQFLCVCMVSCYFMLTQVWPTPRSVFLVGPAGSARPLAPHPVSPVPATPSPSRGPPPVHPALTTTTPVCTPVTACSSSSH